MRPELDPDNTYFISDTHFGHNGIINYCNRPFANRDEMDAKLIENWNAVVRADGVVFHLGDVSFRGIIETLPILGSLNGQLRLVSGNHDYRLLKKETFRQFFSEIRDIKEINMEGRMIVLCHYPMESWHQMHHGSWHLHGHSHGNMPDFGLRMDVGVDAMKVYAPVPYRKISEMMRGKVITSRDHHRVDTGAAES